MTVFNFFYFFVLISLSLDPVLGVDPKQGLLVKFPTTKLYFFTMPICIYSWSLPDDSLGPGKAQELQERIQGTSRPLFYLDIFCGIGTKSLPHITHTSLVRN
jgi:hypothetical protein